MLVFDALKGSIVGRVSGGGGGACIALVQRAGRVHVCAGRIMLAGHVAVRKNFARLIIPGKLF